MILTGFSGLDDLTGGLQEKKNYLVYGNIGTGKTTFSIQFLYHGLLNGEKVVLVTRRSAQSVFELGLAFGLDLKQFARTGQLILLEYVPQVIENSMRLRDAAQIGNEFAAFLGADSVQRLVVDPLTPLLASPSSSIGIFRARSLVQSFSELQATSLFVFDTPEGEEYLGNSKDFVYGVLRFEAGAFQSSQGVMVLERFPELKGRPKQLEYEITPGAGLVEVAAAARGATGAPEATPAQRKILIIEPEEQQRRVLRELLAKNYKVLEADRAADGLAKVAAESPDLILLERESEGLDGVEICRTLRQNKLNVPVVLIADQGRRARDRVLTMAAGADECLEKPVDGRMLKLKIEQLLRRYDSSRDRFAAGALEASVTTQLERDKTTSTTNLAYFYDRVRQEITYSTENALSFVLVVLHLPDGAASRQGLFELVGSLIREYDLVYVGKRGVAILLAEMDERAVKVFLDRVKQGWNRTPVPTVEHASFDRHEDFLQTAKRLVGGIEG